MWALGFLSVLVCIGLNDGQKVRLSWNYNQLANNSMVSNQQLYTSTYYYWTGWTSTYTPVRCELIGLNASATSRQWYGPTGTALPSRNTSANGGYGQVLVQTTGVDLYSGGFSYTTQGIHRCDIVDGNGTLYRLYVAIYNDPSQTYSTASSGPNSISGIQFQQLTALAVDPAVFQLSCTSTYSPATTVQWTYNGSPANGSSFSSYQTVTDLLLSTYNNVLVVKGKMTGVYTCTVTTLCAPACGSFAGPRSFTSSLTLQAPPGPPTQVTVSQTGPTSLRVSWIPGSGPTIGYYILSGAEGAATYTTASSVVPYYDMTTGSQTNNLITVGAFGQYFTSSFTPVAPIITVATLPTVITLTWRQPVDPFGIGAVEGYKVYYNYVGPCPAIIHRGTEDLDGSAIGLTLLGMQEYSTYNLTVTAMKNGGSSMSNIQVQTLTVAPGAPPSTVYGVASSPTSITVGWSSVSCIYQNSMIAKYSVRYGLPYGVMATAETTGYYFTATGLTPYTSYMFQVAAINSAGQRGPFSDPFVRDTKLGPPSITKTQALSPTSVILSWMPSDGDGSTNYSVSYVYQGPCSVSIAGVGYTNATQYTIQGLEEYSSYAVTITAVRGGQVTIRNSTAVTMAAVPSAPPSGLVEISKTSTGATVGWGPVPCLSRNSDISKYRVRYINLNNGTSKQQESFAMTFSTTGLNPYTNYSFEVAAVNTNGLVGPFSTPVIVKTLQPLPPVLSIKTDGSSPTDQGNFSMTCSVSVPMEALGTLTVRWLGPLGPQVVLNSTVASNIGGATVVLGLVFSPITTRDGGWYTCDVTFELYPQAAASTRKKVTVQSDALFQLKLGPTDNCVQWPWSFVPVNDTEETKVDQVQRAVFSTVKSLLVKNYCSCEADSIDWIYSCQTSSSDVVFKYSLHLTSEHCNCSGSDVVSIMDQWVKSAGTVRMDRYQFRASQDCVSTKIVSFDDLECKKN